MNRKKSKLLDFQTWYNWRKSKGYPFYVVRRGKRYPVLDTSYDKIERDYYICDTGSDIVLWKKKECEIENDDQLELL